jgi:hypothetical protein
MALTQLQVNNYCMAGNTCRYLCWENADGKSVAVCTKLSRSYYLQMKRDMQMYGVDLDERGDNCQGFLLLKHKPQGYDVK